MFFDTKELADALQNYKYRAGSTVESRLKRLFSDPFIVEWNAGVTCKLHSEYHPLTNFCCLLDVSKYLLL